MNELFFDRLKKIDKIIARGSTNCNFSKDIEPLLLENASIQYFYNNLKDPMWLEVLTRVNKFLDVPEPKKDPDKGIIYFPIWHESRFLARVAKLAPKEVLEIILQLPDTENIRVHEDIADAALAMSEAGLTDLAAKLVSRFNLWIKSQNQLLLPEKLGKFMELLAKGGQVNESIELARSLLAILPDPQWEEKTKEGSISYLRIEPRSRFDIWNYEQILIKNVPELVKVAGEDTLLLLCDLLETSVRLSRPKSESDIADDNSYFWREAIERQEGPFGGLRDLLVTSVRDSAESLIETKGIIILEIIEKHHYEIFQRISLHLRRKFPKIDFEGTNRLVTNPAVFNNEHLLHEYFHLLSERFNEMAPETKRGYLALVEQDSDKHDKYWKYTKLLPIQEYLGGEWRQKFDEFKKEFGIPEHPDFHFYSEPATWVGPASPKSKTELSSMSIEELIKFLKSWTPSGQLMEPSPEGLSRELITLVASEPSRFATEATKFIELDPTYVRAILSGLRDAIKQKNSIQWHPVLELCQWVINQPRDIKGRESKHMDKDPDWSWTRKAIAELLSVGFDADSAEIPFKFRSVVWGMLKPITDDPDPTPDTEKQNSNSNMDPFTLSINTVRGEAMNTTVRYALWVLRNIKKEPNWQERVARGFDEIPEIREVLDKHLDLSQDSSSAIRSVYGRWFPWLVLLDSRWATQNITKIFPQEESNLHLHDAAWETYIIFCEPYDSVLNLLQNEYRRAIKRIGTAKRKELQLRNIDNRLAEHILTYYWRGKLNFNETQGLLLQFYEKASEKLRGIAIEYVGRSLHNTKGNVAQQIIDRLKDLWSWCLTNTKLPISHEELLAFGWWFVSRKFDDDWSIAQLKKVLEIKGEVDVSNKVSERLGNLATSIPLAAVECLNLAVEKAKDDRKLYGWVMNARNILITALKSTDNAANRLAIDTIHRLGARGYLEFRDLLTETKLDKN